MNEEKESKLEKQVKERGFTIIGPQNKMSEIEILHKKLMDIVDFTKGDSEPTHVVYLGAGDSGVEAARHAIGKLHKNIVIAVMADAPGMGPYGMRGIESLKVPEVMKIELSDLSLREEPRYLFEDNLDKNFNNKGYLSKIKGSQINYKPKKK